MLFISSFFVFFAKKFRLVNLIIEQGNTSSKLAVYQAGNLVASFVHKKLELEHVADLFTEYPLTQGIFSTVIDTDYCLVEYLKSRLQTFILLDETTPLPVTVNYKTPKTLGRDRVAAVVGAHYLKPDCPLLVIDAGTAITYDLIDADGTYWGGNISPGMTTRFKALNHYTQKLPLVYEPETVPFLGDDTVTAIQSGVVNGIIYEMDGYICALKEKYPALLVFLTGGHSFYFESRLKNSIFADINLVLTGLNRILEYNVED